MQEIDKTQENNKENTLINIEWQAPEFEKHPKGIGWFIAVGIAALALFTISLLSKDYIFLITIILAVFTVFIYALKEPRSVTFKITGQGITIDDKNYRYSDLISFWIFYDPPETKELSIRSKNWYMPMIGIPLGEQNPVALREILIKFIPEEKQEPSLINIISRALRF